MSFKCVSSLTPVWKYWSCMSFKCLSSFTSEEKYLINTIYFLVPFVISIWSSTFSAQRAFYFENASVILGCAYSLWVENRGRKYGEIISGPLST